MALVGLNGWALFGYLLIFLGLVGSVIPLIPGPLLIWLGAFAWSWGDGFQHIGWFMLTVLGILALLTWGIDLLMSTAFNRRVGASWKTMIGSFGGGIAGGLLLTIEIPVVGTLIGAFLGSMVGVWLVELWVKRDRRAAIRAVRAYISSSILSSILEVTLTLIMVGLFVWRIMG